MAYELDRAIQEHYGAGVERDRLTTWGRLEAERTRELLRRFLPPPPAVVLDVGGAEGAYALPLAAHGYAVHLVDPWPPHVDAARAASGLQPAAPLASAEVGDARELRHADGSADAVLLLGPLYHLVEAADRAAALAEARRVLRPGGVLLAAAISRFASAVSGVQTGDLADPRFAGIVDGDLADGVHRNPDPAGRPGWFTLSYFHHPDELRDEVAAAGFGQSRVVAVEGVGAAGDSGALLADPGSRDALLSTIRRLESEASLLGASPHLMAVATTGHRAA